MNTPRHSWTLNRQQFHTPDGKTLLTADFDGTTTATRISTGARPATIDHGAKSAPEYVTITPDGRQAWVTLGIGGVAVISLSDYSSKVLPTSGMGLTVTFSNDGTQAYVSEGGPFPGNVSHQPPA